MKRWQPISTVPLDTPVIVTDGRSRRIAVLKTRAPVWSFDEVAAVTAANNFEQLGSSYQFKATHWFSLPKLPVSS